jgi:hypothetical protein
VCIFATYRVDDATEVIVQRCVSEVGDQAEALRLAGVESRFGVADHVLLQHSPDITAGCGVLGEDVLGSSETAFFCCAVVVRIESVATKCVIPYVADLLPVELDSVLQLAWPKVLVSKQNAHGL